jgi:hypothetical protein
MARTGSTTSLSAVTASAREARRDEAVANFVFNFPGIKKNVFFLFWRQSQALAERVITLASSGR